MLHCQRRICEFRGDSHGEKSIPAISFTNAVSTRRELIKS